MGAVKGLTDREGVALSARRTLSNQFFIDSTTANETEIVDFTKEEKALLRDPELKAIVEEYAADESIFYDDFAKAWTKIMNAPMLMMLHWLRLRWVLCLLLSLPPLPNLCL